MVGVQIGLSADALQKLQKNTAVSTPGVYPGETWLCKESVSTLVFFIIAIKVETNYVSISGGLFI